MNAFIREINTMAHCQGKFVVPLVGYTIEPPYSIITEFMPHGALTDYVKIHKRKFQLSGTHLTIIAMCLAWQMSKISEIHVLHRDLKAANILLDADRLPRICDFGIARFDSKNHVLSQRLGTFSHMAPEVMLTKNYTTSVDVYSYAMTLYEMVEGISPFPQMSKDEILDRIGIKGQRPKLNDANNPAPLLALIRKCWCQNPENRPTFDEIFEEFASGKAYFKNSDYKVVQTMAKVLREKTGTLGEDEAIAPVVVRPGPVLERLRRRIDKEQKENDANYNEEQQQIKEVKAAERIVINEKMVPDSLDVELPGYESSELLAILNNSKDPNFLTILQKLCSIVKGKQFKIIYVCVFPNFIKTEDDNDKLLIKVLEVYTELMKRENSVAILFSKAHFFSVLPLATKETRAATLKFIFEFFKSTPNLVNSSFNRVLASFIINQPDDAVQLMIIYALSIDQVFEPFQVLDLYINYARSFVNVPAGSYYIDVLFYLLQVNNEFKNLRMGIVRAIFTVFCKSTIKDVAITAVRALSHYYDPAHHVPFESIIRMVEDREAYHPAISLLQRVMVYPVSRTFVRTLVKRCLQSPTAFPVLWKFAAQQVETAELLIKYPAWLQSTHLYSFRLLLVLCTYPLFRSEIARLPGFTHFVANFAQSKDSSVLIGLSIILRRSSPDQSLIDHLTNAKFFTNYHEAISQTNNQQVLSSLVNLLDCYTRIGYSKQYKVFLRMLTSMLKFRNALTTGAITILSVLSRYPQMQEKLAKPELINYFKALSQVDAIKEKSEFFLKNVEKKNE